MDLAWVHLKLAEKIRSGVEIWDMEHKCLWVAHTMTRFSLGITCRGLAPKS